MIAVVSKQCVISTHRYIGQRALQQHGNNKITNINKSVVFNFVDHLK